jgi:hypothetical protein
MSYDHILRLLEALEQIAATLEQIELNMRRAQQ